MLGIDFEQDTNDFDFVMGRFVWMSLVRMKKDPVSTLGVRREVVA